MNIFKKILGENIKIKEIEKEIVESDEDSEEITTISKEDIIDLLDMMSPEDIDDLGTFILDFLSTDDEGNDIEDTEMIDDTEEELDSADNMTERKYFDKKKIDLKRDKMQDKSARRMKAIKLKRLYKANKNKIKRKAAIYRKKVKRNPMVVKIHKQ